MIGVIILHYNNPGIGGALKYAETGSINYYLLSVIESIFVCAVDLFMVISGYFMANTTKRDLWKPIQLLVQVSILSAAKYVFIQGLIYKSFELSGLIKSIIPINYFAILYVTVFLISPYVNILFERLDKRQTLRFIGLLFIVFSIYPTFVDVLREITKNELNGLSSVSAYGSQYGYSAVNFILCYCVGVFIKKNEDQLNAIKTRTLMLISGGTVLTLTVWAVINDKIGFSTEKSAWEYCNPLVIISAFCFFLLFKRIKMNPSGVINSLAKGAFTVYLLHINFVTHIGIDRYASGNFILMLIHMICSSVLIYIICWCIYVVYSMFEKFIFSKLKKVVMLPDFNI
jgi:hypothetical protein